MICKKGQFWGVKFVENLARYSFDSVILKIGLDRFSGRMKEGSRLAIIFN